MYHQVNRDEQEGEVGVSGGAAEGSVSSGDTDDCFDGKETDKDPKKKKNRCAVCRKKVGLTGKGWLKYLIQKNKLKSWINANYKLKGISWA